MGITIHCAGKAKSLEAIMELMDMLALRAGALHWRTEMVDDVIRGRFFPNWGYGFGYVPSKEDIQSRKIEFFPQMVSLKCNGYFRIFDGPYADRYRASFRKGKYLSFRIDTRVKGMIIYPHQFCDVLSFTFDLKTLKLASYGTWGKNSEEVHGGESLSCKTQSAGFKVHVMVCETIRLAERYVEFSMIKDEAEYYQSRDLTVGIRNFNEMMFNIKEFGKFLNDIGKRHGLSAKSGDET